MNEAELLETVRGFQRSALLMALVELDICGFLAAFPGGATVEEIAGGLELKLRPLERLLPAAVALGFLNFSEGRFSNTVDSEAFLASGSKSYLGRQIKSYAEQYQGWGRLTEVVREGELVLPNFQEGPGEEEVFRKILLGLHASGQKVVPQMLTLLSPYLQNCKTLLDIGGGVGTYSLAFAGHYPGLKVTLVDRPAVLQIAEEIAATSPVREQLEFLPADYHVADFEPGKYDTVLLFQVLRTESPEIVLALLKKAALSLAPGGFVIIYDTFLDEGKTAPPENVLQNLTMAMMYREGGLFTLSELAGWLNEAGLSLLESFNLMSSRPMALVIAREKI